MGLVNVVAMWRTCLAQVCLLLAVLQFLPLNDEQTSAALPAASAPPEDASSASLTTWQVAIGPPGAFRCQRPFTYSASPGNSSQACGVACRNFSTGPASCWNRDDWFSFAASSTCTCASRYGRGRRDFTYLPLEVVSPIDED